ncbi:LPXTG cell wall anchor domain-containing protein [uncultured Bifidobacterium sp.]
MTGGRGILLLLVVGALIMGGALYARNRRNNAARA